jgi:hypothetical protein
MSTPDPEASTRWRRSIWMPSSMANWPPTSAHGAGEAGDPMRLSRRTPVNCALLKDRVKCAYAEPPALPQRARASPATGRHGAGGRDRCFWRGIGAGWLARDFSGSPDFDRLAGLPEGYRAVALSQQIDPNKIILHLDSGDAGGWKKCSIWPTACWRGNARASKSSSTVTVWICCAPM